MIISIADQWSAEAIAKHRAYGDNLIDAWLVAQDPATAAPIEKQFEAFLQQERHRIVHRNADHYPLVVSAFELMFPGKKDRGLAKKLASKVFDYTTFSKKPKAHKPGVWDAYALCFASKYKVCPYCHKDETDTRYPAPGKRGYRPQLDHFYSKARYPYLALSLYNLVPSCDRCNGPMMKGVHDALKVPHLHPYLDAEQIGFELVPIPGQAIDAWLLNSFRAPRESYRIELTGQPGKAAQSMKTFQLVDRYNSNDPLDRALQLVRDSFKPGLPQERAESALGVELTWPDFSKANAYRDMTLGKMQLDVYNKVREKYENADL